MFDVSMKILVLILFPFVQDITTTLEEKNDVEEATVEILVLLEKNLSDWFQNSSHRHSHFCKLFQDVNDIYKNIDGVKINIALKGLKMIKQLEDQPFLENYMVTNSRGTFINEFSLYTFLDFALRQEWLKEYDAVILLVNKKMTDGTGYAVGLSLTPGMCGSWFNGAIASPDPLVIAHEIAHLLGVKHDSEYTGCSKQDKYLMTNKPKLYEKFSDCSANVLRMQLKNLGGKGCLWEENAKDTAKCKPCDFLSRSECTNFDGIMKKLGLDRD